MQSSAAKGSSAPAGVEARAQHGTERGSRARRAGPRQGVSPGTCDGRSAWTCSSDSRGVAYPVMPWLGPGGWAGGLGSARCQHCHQLHQIMQCLSLFMSRKIPSFPLPVLSQEGRKHAVHPAGPSQTSDPGGSAQPGDGKERASPLSKPAHGGDQETANVHVILFLQHVSYPSLFFSSDLSKNKRNGKAFSKISFFNDSPSATKSKQVACA